MVRPRAIPVLLWQGAGLVKTIRFRRPRYLGDPVNIVRLFSDKEADELILLDIAASQESRGPRFEELARLAGECFMPLCYGGGVGSLEDMQRLFALGVEKVAINTAALMRPALITEAAREFGSQSVVVAIDIGRRWWGRYEVARDRGRIWTGLAPREWAMRAEQLGAGEILLTDVDRDGTMTGLDTGILGSIASSVKTPVIACGGVSSLADLGRGIAAGASAVAAGSLFVFHGPHQAVLVNYPTVAELNAAWPTKR